jgi:hypothetical protein
MCPAVLEAEVREIESAGSVLGVEQPRRVQGHGLSAGKSPKDAGEITGADLRWIAKDLLRTLFGDNPQAGARWNIGVLAFSFLKIFSNLGDFYRPSRCFWRIRVDWISDAIFLIRSVLKRFCLLMHGHGRKDPA